MDKIIFFELLREAREIGQSRTGGYTKQLRRLWVAAYREGMKRMYQLYQEDIAAGRNIKEVWRCNNSGAER